MCEATEMRLSLRALRVNANLTQGELGERLGVSGKTISSWEKGATMPSFNKIEEICDFFGVGYDAIRWKV